MGSKEGDSRGLAPIRSRLDMDENLLRTVFGIHGVPKVLLRNHIPVADAKTKFDDYEITPEFVFKLNKKGNIEVSTREWVIKDDNGKQAHSLMAPAVAISMFKQIAAILE
jgi:hypothetical protein